MSATSSDGCGRTLKRRASISIARFFPPDDLRFEQILAQVKHERDARAARIGRDKNKNKLASLRARSRRHDITELSRVKDNRYPLEKQAIA
jgi:hypothetical protein